MEAELPNCLIASGVIIRAGRIKEVAATDVVNTYRDLVRNELFVRKTGSHPWHGEFTATLKLVR